MGPVPSFVPSFGPSFVHVIVHVHQEAWRLHYQPQLHEQQIQRLESEMENWRKAIPTKTKGNIKEGWGG